ncbi:tyrosine-type recombinase/integrase [Pseudomonas sp. HK3]
MARPRLIRRLSDNRKKKAPVLTPRELKRLLFVATQTRNPERNVLIVWLLFAAGFRISEVAGIEIKDVLWKSGKLKNDVIIPAKYCKNNKAGHVFFYHKKLLNALEQYIKYRVVRRLIMDDNPHYRGLKKDSKVILSENKRAYALKQKKRVSSNGEEKIYWACDTLQTMVTKWGREAGIKGFSTHSGRRTLATRSARLGASEVELCVLLRHETDDMPYEYTDADIMGIKRTLETLYAIDDERLHE